MRLSRQLTAGLIAAAISVIILAGSLVLSLVEDAGSTVVQPSPSGFLYPTIPSPIATIKLGELAAQSSSTPISSIAETEPTPRSECKPPENWIEITVGSGETLESLAAVYEIPVPLLLDGNCLVEDILKPGMPIFVPEVIEAAPEITSTPTMTLTLAPGECRKPDNWTTYTVKRGDTLFSVSRAHGISVDEIKDANCLTSNNIVTGARLFVPDLQAAPTDTPIP